MPGRGCSCVQCHPHPIFTNVEKRDPGLGSGVLCDVPSLIEVWRTAPYLHRGDALPLRQAITDYNWMPTRGHTRDLSEAELADLTTCVKSPWALTRIAPGVSMSHRP